MENISYKKNKNTVFPFLENMLDVSEPQNYLPIYNKFFELNDTNRNSINLNNKWEVTNIHKKISDKIYECTVSDGKNNKKVNLFFKFAPLLDPIKYLIGKYNDDDINLLPNNGCTNKKILDNNNSAYVDGFFSYLNSRLYHEYGFVHAVDFYGEYIGIKNNFKYDIEDDIDYVLNSTYFNNNKDTLFSISSDFDNLLKDDSYKKPKIKINKSQSKNIDIDHSLNVNCLDISAVTFENLQKLYDDTLKQDDTLKHDDEKCSSKSSCSSRSSLTDDKEDNDEDEDDNEDDDEEGDTDDQQSNDEDVNMDVCINRFPVNIISLEACQDTLDSLIEDEDISFSEILSALMQVIMILITYQKAFDFTHNDLHTNNIMYIPTEKQFLYYCYNGNHYKVPTHNRIFKIIDYGRAIFKYKGHTFCSDSFDFKGDAATQYNCEPYFNEKKPRLEPNKSFDLSRLACSMYDNLVDDEEDEKLYNPVKTILEKWCTDDKDRNVLYKKNGEERYPEFKLYKMIARSVNNHTPSKQLDDDIFKRYAVSKKSIKKSVRVINIDEIPVLI